VVSGQWSVVSGQWSLVISQWSLVISQWSLVISQLSLVIRKNSSVIRKKEEGFSYRRKRRKNDFAHAQKKPESTGRKSHICAIKNALKVARACDKILVASPNF
jgi:hypothetical protein